MNEYSLSKSLLLFSALLIASITIRSKAAWADDPTVQVRDAAVREIPSALGKVTGTLEYGEKVRFLGEPQNGWYHVARSEGGLEGWLRQSAIEKQGFSLKPGESNAQNHASSEELAYAAKGMDEVEQEFSHTNSALVTAYSELDRLESSPLCTVSDSEILTFLEGGSLRLNQDFLVQGLPNE